jgi:hypothetical protein
MPFVRLLIETTRMATELREVRPSSGHASAAGTGPAIGTTALSPISRRRHSDRGRLRAHPEPNRQPGCTIPPAVATGARPATRRSGPFPRRTHISCTNILTYPGIEGHYA